ncbi:MAG: YdcF family protein [Suilimivivens sp.]
MITDYINILGQFLGCRDISEISQKAVFEKYGFRQADVFVLFGGSIIYGGDVMAEAIRNKVAGKYVIVGGAGHTTETLRKRVHTEYPDIQTEGLSEAEIFSRYLDYCYGLKADYLECHSTNCGNNITMLLQLLQDEKINLSSVILCQDASMQRRMAAGLQKYRPDVTIINYAAYRATVVEKNGRPEYAEPVKGMWDMDRYLTLLMGEIPRLRDNEDGYGPKGKNYIAHVDIPDEVESAFEKLKVLYADHIRIADSQYQG